MSESNNPSLAVIVQRVLYAGDGSWAAVVGIGPAGKRVSVCGSLGTDLSPGQTLKVFGGWKKHPKHGLQWVGSIEEPAEGHGPRWPWDALESLAGSAGQSTAQVLGLLRSLGRAEAEAVLACPYRLAARDSGPGLPWPALDALGQKAGHGPESAARLDAAFQTVLAGWPGRLKPWRDRTAASWAPAEQAVAEVASLAGLPAAAIAAHLDQSPACRIAALPGQIAVLVAPLAQAEDSVLAFCQDRQGSTSVPPARVASLPFDLSAEQEAALRGSLTAPLSCIFGPPGVGKTRTIAEIVRVLEAAGQAVSVCAPTGKAAFRLRQVSGGRPAQTVHRLLRAQGSGRDSRRFSFFHGRDCPLPGPQTVIVDEASMLDTALASALVQAVGPTSRLILVGDSNQIPPVSPGQPFLDLLDSGCCPALPLTRIFRQVEGSAIARACALVLAGDSAGLFRWLRGPEAQAEISYRAVDQDLDLIPAVLSCLPDSGQLPAILAPTNVGPAGTIEINKAVQQWVQQWQQSQGLALPSGQVLHLGDPVFQTRNDYRRGVFNGDSGVVIKVQDAHRSQKAEVQVKFPFAESAEQAYALPEAARDLLLGYALSVHRAQGSEWPEVLLVLPRSASFFTSRRLLYTALSRAKSRLTILAAPETVQKAISLGTEPAVTRLGTLLREQAGSRLSALLA